jgi:broad specificity phosphatase PhoE
MKKNKIFLIRHGETKDNLAGIPLGQNDSPLTKRGREQAEKTGDFLKDKNIDTVYSSDLGRAAKTAEIIAEKLNLKVSTTPDFRELSLGDWQGLSFEELREKSIQLTKELQEKGIDENEIRAPGGENTFDHRKRAMRKFKEIVDKHQGENIVIVAHSGTNKVLLGAIQNLSVKDYYKINQTNCCINEIHITPSGYEVNKINYFDHLK